MQRRNFLASAAAFFVAPKIVPVLPAAPVVAAVPKTAYAPTVAVLTNADIDRIYKLLQEATVESWTQRYREAYQQLTNDMPSCK